MILNNSVNAGGFIYCMAYFGPKETGAYLNSGDGHFHQYFYVVDGRCIAEIKDDKDSEPIAVYRTEELDRLVNQESLRGKYTCIKTQDSGISIMFFNPIPETRNLMVEILQGSTKKTITASDKRITLIAITGPIKANDKTLESLQHAKIFPGKTVELTLPEYTTCALVTG